MGFRMAEGDAAGALDACQRQRVGGCAGGDEEDRNLTLEDLGKTGFDLSVEIAGAIGGGKAGRFRQ